MTPNLSRARRVWFVLIVAVVLLIALAVWNSARMSMSMSAAASDEQQFAQNAPGTSTKIVVEIAESTRTEPLKENCCRRKPKKSTQEPPPS